MANVVNDIPQGSVTEIEREKAAKLIATILTVSFVVLLGLPLLLFIGSSPTIVAPTVTDLIKTIASVFSGLVGAVIGYYFRSTQSN
jgi:hypothetical protein